MKQKFKKLLPIQKFINTESAGGILLFGMTVIALLWANVSTSYAEVWDFEIGITTDAFELKKPLLLWINDGLMTIFFFLIGLEIKREVSIGELNSFKKASLPILAAIGGMIGPMFIYVFFAKESIISGGWGIPMATDIAFSLAILQLLGKRVPLALKIFLMAFAIVDDLGAIVIIAIFYSSNINFVLLLIAGAILIFLGILSYKNIYNKYFFLLGGIIIWVLFLKSGIHPTIAGVLIAFTIPIRQKIYIKKFTEILKKITNNIENAKNHNQPVLTKEQIAGIDNLEDWTHKVQSPLQHLEHGLHNWVAYLIMPIFALANAGVVLNISEEINMTLIYTLPIALIGGNVIGVMLMSFIGTKLKITVLPKEMKFLQLIGVSFLAGVGFTMSIFIANIAFADSQALLDSAKIGILLGSIISGIIGYIILKFQFKE